MDGHDHFEHFFCPSPPSVRPPRALGSASSPLCGPLKRRLSCEVRLFRCALANSHFSSLCFDGCFTQMVRLETHVVRRCKALQAAAWQRHARFEATQQVRSNCVFQGQGLSTVSRQMIQSARVGCAGVGVSRCTSSQGTPAVRIRSWRARPKLAVWVGSCFGWPRAGASFG